MLDEDVRTRLARYAESLNVEPPLLDPVLQRARRKSVDHRVAGAGLVLVVVLATILSTHVLSLGDRTSSYVRDSANASPGAGRAGAGSLEPFPGPAPIPAGMETTIGVAAHSVSFPLFRPRDPQASDLSLTHVWLSDSHQQVALEYSSGILVLVERAQFSNAADKYRAMQAEHPAASVITIGHAPALVIPGNIPGQAGAVDMVIGVVHVQVQGRTSGVTDADLVRIASSIDQSAV